MVNGTHTEDVCFYFLVRFLAIKVCGDMVLPLSTGTVQEIM